MRFLSKKLISLLLVSALLMSVFAGGISAQAAGADNSAELAQALLPPNSGSGNPVIVVPGIGMSSVALFDEEGNKIPNEGTFPDEWNVLNLDTAPLMDNLWKIIPKALLSLIFQRDMGLSNAVREYMPGIFRYAQHDLNGKSIENVQAIERKYPLSEYDEDAKRGFYNMMPMEKYAPAIGEDRIYCFNFPPFCNTYDQAAKLNEFIQIVKEQTGAEKVNLVPLSLGSTVTNAYLDEYADRNDVAKVVRIVGASDGSDVFADLVAQNLSENSARLFYRDMFPQLMKGYGGYLVNIAVRILPKKVLNNVLDAAFDVVRYDFFVNTPSMWAIIPADRYEELADIYLSGPEYEVIRAQTDKYYAYQSNLQENIDRHIQDGIQFYNICGYGFNFGHGWSGYEYFQFFRCADDVNSDGIIQLTSTGMGAYSAAPGTTLPDGYVQQNTCCTNPDHNHISPDRVVDASTCYLPEQTWFFAGQHHECANNDVIVRLACILMAGDTITSVHSDPDFPQFNGSRYTRRIVKDLLPRCIEAQGRTDLSAADMAELNAAVDEANAMLDSTVADDAQCNAVEARLRNILVKIGVLEPPAQPETYEIIPEAAAKIVSDLLWDKFGPAGFSEIAKTELIKTIAVLIKLVEMF